MRVIFSGKRLAHARDSSSWFQYQAEVRFSPCVASSPRAWMSLMNTSKPASFMVSVTPNSLADFTDAMNSPPALARPRLLAPEDCAFPRNEKNSAVQSGKIGRASCGEKEY